METNDSSLQLYKNPTPDVEANEFSSPDEKRKLAETQYIRESNKDLRANRKLSWIYAKWVFCYLVSYSVFVGLLLLASGYKIFGFVLDKNVLNFLVGSTAASAIGLVLEVTTGLFKPLKKRLASFPIDVKTA